MTASQWDDLFRPGEDRPPGRLDGWRASLAAFWEGGLTLLLVGALLFSVALSIEEADWVDEMPSLVGAVMLGLLTGWLLMRLPAPQWLRHLAGGTVGLVTTVAMTAQTLELSDPEARSGPRGRLTELGDRSGDWFDALLSGGISSDSVVFVMGVVAAAWAIAYLAAWAVGQWHNPWIALGPAGFVLLTNISYLPGQPSRWFVVFLFTAVLLFSRLHMLGRLATADRTDGVAPTRPPFLSLEVLHATWWLGLVLVVAAWLIPSGGGLGPLTDRFEQAITPVTDRTDALGRLFVGIDSKRARRIHPFHDALPLEGRIEPSDDVLMYVDAEEAIYLRVGVFDQYSAVGWVTGFGEPGATEPFTQELLDFGSNAARSELRRPVTITVQVEEPYQDRRLLTAGEPLGSDRPAQIVTGGAAVDGVAIEPDQRLRDGDVYRTVGAVSAAPVEALIGAASTYPAWVRERYLQLPAGYSPQVTALAQEIAGGGVEPYVQARLVQAFLRQTYPIDFEISDPPPRADAVEHFLFTEQRGYYDYHASAMVVMLRAVGVPARLSIGFVLEPGAVDPITESFIVTEQQAWAWAEVYFPQYGWVAFNPTPDRPPLLPPGDDSEFIRALGGIATPGEIDPLNPGVADDELFVDSPDLDALPVLEEELPRGARGPESRVALIGAVLGVSLAVLAVAAVAGYWLWNRPFRDLSPAADRWARTVRLATWAGVRLSDAATPLESAAEIRNRLRIETNLAPLARAYGRERYGPAAGTSRIAEDTEANRDRAVDLGERYVAARSELLRRWLGRAVPRLHRREQHREDPAVAGAADVAAAD